MPGEGLAHCCLRGFAGICSQFSGELTRAQGPQPCRQGFHLVSLLRASPSLRDRLASVKLMGLKGQRASLQMLKHVTTLGVLMTGAFSPHRQTSIGIQILIQSYLLSMESKKGK